MLPITNHRGIHIPHSLATAAAIVATIVALVTAPAWDVSDTDAAGEDNAGNTLDQVTSTTSQTAESVRVDSTGCEPGVFSGLLPLVLPSFSGY